MAASYTEILGSSANAALAIPEIWNTPETSVPGAYSTVAMVKAVSGLLNKMGANVPMNGDKNDPKFVAAMRARFGGSWDKNYLWREIVEALYADVQAGRKLSLGGGSFLDVIPGPRVSGFPILPIVAVAAIWYFTRKKR